MGCQCIQLAENSRSFAQSPGFNPQYSLNQESWLTSGIPLPGGPGVLLLYIKFKASLGYMKHPSPKNKKTMIYTHRKTVPPPKGDPQTSGDERETFTFYPFGFEPWPLAAEPSLQPKTFTFCDVYLYVVGIVLQRYQHRFILLESKIIVK